MCLFQFWFPRCVCPAVGLLGHKAVLFVVFQGISTLFSIVAVLVCIPTNSVRGLPFLNVHECPVVLVLFVVFYCLYSFDHDWLTIFREIAFWVFCVMCLCAQSCPVLWDPMDCSPQIYSVHWIFQARLLDWVAISYSRRSSWTRDQTWVSCISCIGRQIPYQLHHPESQVCRVE